MAYSGCVLDRSPDAPGADRCWSEQAHADAQLARVAGMQCGGVCSRVKEEVHSIAHAEAREVDAAADVWRGLLT